jgi:hypothetical protein
MPWRRVPSLYGASEHNETNETGHTGYSLDRTSLLSVDKIDYVSLRCVGIGILKLEYLINAIVTNRLEADE